MKTLGQSLTSARGLIRIALPRSAVAHVTDMWRLWTVVCIVNQVFSEHFFTRFFSTVSTHDMYLPEPRTCVLERCYQVIARAFGVGHLL